MLRSIHYLSVVFALSLYDLLRNGDQTQNRLLRDGDTLHIPTAIDQGRAMMGQVRTPRVSS